MPVMGKITVPECECFPDAINYSLTWEGHSHAALLLVFRQNPIYRNRNQLPRFIPEPEPDRGNPPICVSAGNHLHRNIDMKHAFHRQSPSCLLLSLSSLFCFSLYAYHITRNICLQSGDLWKKWGVLKWLLFTGQECAFTAQSVRTWFRCEGRFLRSKTLNIAPNRYYERLPSRE